MHDLIVLGGGPAGLTATMYALQKRLDVMLVTRDLGGKTNYHLQLPFVERHMVINGDEIVSRFTREIEYLDFVRKMDNAEKVEQIEGGYRVSLSSGEKLDGRALIVATGAKGQLLNVPGEREFMMRGLCYSAVSYAQLFYQRTAAVVGCGELALRSTAELAQVARHVTMIARQCDLLDTPLAQRLRAMPHVEFLLGYDVKEVKGDVYARSIIVSGADADREIEADAIFVELDLIPRSDVVAGLVELDEKKRIKVNARHETSAPGIFAAGDVTDSYAEQVLIAIGEGAKAALGAWEYLLKQGG
jgi:thioredoxin reductase